MTLPTALAASCDTYFYEVGNRFYELPPERGQPLQHWAARVRLRPDERPSTSAARTRASCRRSPGSVEHFTTEIDKLWKPGDSIQLAIGQKDLLVTPLQMARFYALLANGGKLVTPYLVSNVEQPGERRRPRPSSAQASRRRRRSRSSSTRRRSTPSDEGLCAATHRSRTARRSACSAASRCPIARQDRHGREGGRTEHGSRCSTSRGGAATAPVRTAAARSRSAS